MSALWSFKSTVAIREPSQKLLKLSLKPLIPMC